MLAASIYAVWNSPQKKVHVCESVCVCMCVNVEF